MVAGAGVASPFAQSLAIGAMLTPHALAHGMTAMCVCVILTRLSRWWLCDRSSFISCRYTLMPLAVNMVTHPLPLPTF